MLRPTAKAILATAACLLCLHSLAEAQSRGTLQATATVVETKSSLQALGGVQTAIRTWEANGKAALASDSTLARISLAVSSPQPVAQRTLVVRVEYLNN